MKKQFKIPTILMALFAILLISFSAIAAPNKAASTFDNTAVVKVFPAQIDIAVVPDAHAFINCITPPAAKTSQQVNNATAKTTGYNDHPTKKADIIAWQKQNGLHPDGNWGPACKAKFAEIKAKKHQATAIDTSPGNIADAYTTTAGKLNNTVDDTSPGKCQHKLSTIGVINMTATDIGQK